MADRPNHTLRVGIAGVASKPYRAKAVERYLRGKELTPEYIAKAATRAAKDVEPLNDIHASAEFRVHLAQVSTQRALQLAASRA